MNQIPELSKFYLQINKKLLVYADFKFIILDTGYNLNALTKL